MKQGDSNPRRRPLHIVRGDFQNHRLLISQRLLFAKGHAPLACSVVNALATALCRYQSFARKRRREQGLAQRSKKSRKSGSPKIFSGTARGVAKQLRALLPLPNKKDLRLCGGLSCFIEQKRTRGTRSVPGNACERRLVDACCISCAAISKITAYSFRGVSSSQKVTLRSPARL